MGRIVVTEFISLDGVIEDPGGSEDFKHGGWSFEFNRGEDGNRFKLEETQNAEAMLLGRHLRGLRRGVAAEGEEDETGFADKFNTMPKYVVSSKLKEPLEWNNSKLLEGDPIKATEKLKDELDGEIVVHGSATLAQSLIENDLVDEIRLMVFPVVLGRESGCSRRRATRNR